MSKVKDFLSEHEIVVKMAIIYAVIGLGMLLIVFLVDTFCNFRFSEQKLTGYVYAVDDTFNYTKGHLRFSENAGTDNQPSFCVNGEGRDLIRSLAGSGMKVSVTIPAGYTVAPFWECDFPATVEVLEGYDE